MITSSEGNVHCVTFLKKCSRYFHQIHTKMQILVRANQLFLTLTLLVSKSTVSDLDLFLVLHLSSINKMFQDIFFLKTSHIDKYIAVKER